MSAMNGAEAQPDRRPPSVWRPALRYARKALKWAVFALIGLVLALHLYALILNAAPVPGSILMVQRAAEGEMVRRDAVPIDQISPHLVTAVIAAEDSLYCSHRGVDFEAIRLAWQEWRTGERERLRGGSTITQQTAKNVFFWNGGGFIRKAGDAWMALVIDFGWGKRRVMERYLNIAEWGDGLFGAEAAAQARFGKPASQLTRREAAMLAAVLPSPNRWRVDPPGPYVQRRTNTLLARMNVVESEGLADCVLAPEASR